MGYLTDSGKKLAKEALFKLNLDEDSWALPELLGSFIGKQISLLGCTNNPQSLNAVYVAIDNLVSDFNELRTFRVDAAVNMAKSFVKRRYNAFFEGLQINTGGEVSCDDSQYCFEVLTRKNTAETLQAVSETLVKVIQSSGITVLIHNQEKPAQAAPTQQEAANSTPPQEAQQTASQEA